MNIIDKIKSNISIISLVLISFGYIRIYYFYRYFNLYIVNYLDLSEIILLSLKYFLIGFTLLIIAGSIFLTLQNSFKDAILKRKKRKKKIYRQKNNIFCRLFKRLKLDWHQLLISLIIILANIFFNRQVFYSCYCVEGWLSISMIYVFFFIGNIGLDEVIYSYNSFYNPIKKLYQLKYIVLFYFSIFLFLKWFTQSRAFMITNTPKTNFYLEYENKVFETDNFTSYLGETRNYIFIYDNCLMYTYTIKKDQIKNLTYSYYSRNYMKAWQASHNKPETENTETN